MTLVVVIVILYLTFVATKYIGKGVGARTKSRYMKIVDQMALGQDKSIAIVKMGAQYYLIGIASSQITILSEVQEEDLTPIELSDDTGEKVPDFKEILLKLGNKRK